MKIVFLGSDVALPVLKELVSSKHEILAVVCKPDKPNARGNKIEICEIKKFALQNNLKVLQYVKFSTEGYEDIKHLNPDIIVCAAFGQLISQKMIDLSKYPTLNVHPSLLPKYRGPSPIISSILNGDKESGVAIMQMVLEMDAGPVYVIEKVNILENETGGQLTERLFNIGAKILLEVMDKVENNTAKCVEQNKSEVTFCKMINKEDAKLDFNLGAEELKNKVRAFNPTPVAYFEYLGEKYKVFESEIVLENSNEYINICNSVNKNSFKNGEIVYSKAKPFGLVIKAENGFFMPKQIQAPNGKVMDIKSYLNGKSFNIGEIIWKFAY